MRENSPGSAARAGVVAGGASRTTLKLEPHVMKRDDFLSASREMLQIRQLVSQIADINEPVLILGESGVGKEVIARYIHHCSERAEQPFVKINCSAVPNDLLEAEFFGYERGAFTGAVQQKPGKFELADRGSVMLDEIGEMGPALQAKLLHVLQDREYSRLGGKHQVKVDARIIAATNKNLDEAISKGEFREDLYFRLNVIKIEVPPLRKRTEDIPLLSDYFLRRCCQKYGRAFEPLPEVLLKAFLAYEWPGNVRELENAVKRYAILADIDLVLSDLRVPSRTAVESIDRDMSLKQVGARAAEQAEKRVALAMLEHTNWNRREAAKRLGICYKALLNKLKKWDIERTNGHAVH